MKKTLTKQTYEVARLAAGVVLRTGKADKATEAFEDEKATYPDQKVYLWTWSGSRRVREQVL
jgi:hypothetical protein